ncbi:MAG: T9SS type A sorting domain-containing protein [Flavobacteriales bacterium]|nr:T9SS type A sorting domain-containing protein [Flavobacteriales bacterium]
MKNTILNILLITSSSLGVIAQNVNIPDANFKAYLVGNAAINSNGDTEIQVNEANSFTGNISCQNQNITDLTGIEAFVAIEGLYCGDNNISSLNVSQNTALTALQCQNNNINSIDVSQNTLLNNFVCLNNNLTSLDLTQNSNLNLLVISDNALTTIDLSQNTGITVFQCSNNSLTALDISNNQSIYSLNCSGNNLTAFNMSNISTSTLTSLDATSNPNLTCIKVDDVAAATATWTNIDPASSFSLNCAILVNSISVIGQGGASAITTLGGTLQMSATVLPANADDNTYTWSVVNGTGSASINSNGQLTAIADGTVDVIATANDGSGVTGSATITISNQSVSVTEQHHNNMFSIYPNPAKTTIGIHTNASINEIQIIDLIGKIVLVQNSNYNNINISDLNSGIYYVKINTPYQTVTKQFIKKQ